MLTTGTGDRLTVRDVLFQDVSERRDVLDRLASDPALEGPFRHLGRIGRSAVRDQLAGAVDDVTGIRVIDVLSAGWRKHRELREAARASLREPTRDTVVTLAAHRIESTHEPAIDVVVGGAPMGQLKVRIEVSLVVSALAATITDARLTHVRTDEVAVEASFGYAGVTLLEGDRRVPMHHEVNIAGWDLVTAAERTAARAARGDGATAATAAPTPAPASDAPPPTGPPLPGPT